MDVAYGTLLHDSKVAQSWVILLRLWQVTVTFKRVQINSYLTVLTALVRRVNL